MGQEIDKTQFTRDDFRKFSERLRSETTQLKEWFDQAVMSNRGPVAGFEIEAWMIDRDFRPAPRNQPFIDAMPEEIATPELATFNIELNNEPRILMGRALSDLQQALESNWNQASEVAASLDTRILSIGILPTLKNTDLSLRYMSPLKRYRALNEQVIRSRGGRALQLDIVGRQHLSSSHNNVMLEAGATSLQIHIQTPFNRAHHVYNASIAISAPLIAICANSPYLFGYDLWDETRIPLFEQAVEIGGFEDVAQGPLRRVSFGSSYARDSIFECFNENVQHFPVLLPRLYDEPTSKLRHLQLHNGTIWRWNRPLVGFDHDGTPHIRIEHRILPASPSIIDSVANAALYYGLVEGMCNEIEDLTTRLPFTQAKDNFYQAARHGLQPHINWLDGEKYPIRTLLQDKLLPLARRGLQTMGIEDSEAGHYLDIIEARLESGQNGCQWQRQFMEKSGQDMRSLTAAYYDLQQGGEPVHRWII